MSKGFEGVETVVVNLGRVKGKMREGAREGIGVALINTLQVSNRQVPFEEGDLERDGGISVDDSKLIGAVSYGRSAQTRDYAVPQHERMDYHHDSGRNAKFLENAVHTTREQNLGLIAEGIKRKSGLS